MKERWMSGFSVQALVVIAEIIWALLSGDHYARAFQS